MQTCEVVFKPAADVDLSYISGWDSEKKVVKGKITVVVSSIEESSEDQPSDTAADVETGDESSEASVPDDTTSDNKDTDIKGIAEIIIAKQRNGPIGTVKMAWIPEQTRFADLLDRGQRV